MAEPAPDVAAAPQTEADFASETDGTFDFATDFEAALDWESGPAVDPIDQFQQQAKAAAKPTPQNTSPSLYTAPVQQQRFVRTTKVVKKLVPGPKIAFPAGSVPVTVTSGFQLAVPQGYQAFQAPDGSFFLMRR